MTDKTKVVLTVTKSGVSYHLMCDEIPGLHVVGRNLGHVLMDVMPLWRGLYKLAPDSQHVPKPPDSNELEEFKKIASDLWDEKEFGFSFSTPEAQDISAFMNEAFERWFTKTWEKKDG